MPVIRAADIASIMTPGLQLDEPTLETHRALAEQATHEIREGAEGLTFYTDEFQPAANRPDLLRLPVLTHPHPVQDLNLLFHRTMRTPAYMWAREKGFDIMPEIFSCNILWLQGGYVKCPENMVTMLIFVPRPRLRGSVTLPEEPPSEGIIRSPIAGPVTTDSIFKCRVGEVIFLEAGEQVLLREEACPRDICICGITHRTTLLGGTGKGDFEQL
ncbi:hypothetical protein B0T24DRAFT_337671 [Lasiosphaeria ovina]|uniref:Uncharacterized protein n=1 Tax=Lasiosphaeria ovina TaxID=92902 RepID=A0AAE0K7Z3_9PEZI|nr:hypothetical protein B0T24DRAFT_337671 [Lasiosphaeria ovina]